MTKGDAIIIDIRVVPRASRSEIVGFEGDVLKVRIAAPPVDNAANTELIKLLAKALGVSKTAVELIGGQSSRSKRVRISGVAPSTIDRILNRKAGS